MKKIFGYIGHAANITDKRYIDRQYRSIKEWAAKKEMGGVQFVIEYDTELTNGQKKELEMLLHSRILSGDVLIADPRTLGSSMLDAMKVLFKLVQKDVTVYCLQGSELVWNVEPKTLAFIESAIAEIHGEEVNPFKDQKGDGKKSSLESR